MRQISETALAKRIGRKLAQGGERLRKCREGSRNFYELGRYFITDKHNWVTAKDIALEAYGRDLGVLTDNEALAP